MPIQSKEEYVNDQKNLLALAEDARQHALGSAKWYEGLAEKATDPEDKESAERARSLMLSTASLHEGYINQLREHIESIESLPGDHDVIG